MTYSRTTVASTGFVLCFLLSSARLVLDAPTVSGSKGGPDEIAMRSYQRFFGLKAALPERGVVGYIGEPGPLALGDYYLTGYALAPVIVDHSPDHDLVIGNFPNSPPLSAPTNLQLKKDFGGGVLLFETYSAARTNKTQRGSQ